MTDKKKYIVTMGEDEAIRLRDKVAGTGTLMTNTVEEALEDVIGIQPGDYPGGPDKYVVEVTELDTQALAEKIYNKLNEKGVTIGNVSILLIKQVLDSEK